MIFVFSLLSPSSVPKSYPVSRWQIATFFPSNPYSTSPPRCDQGRPTHSGLIPNSLLQPRIPLMPACPTVDLPVLERKLGTLLISPIPSPKAPSSTLHTKTLMQISLEWSLPLIFVLLDRSDNGVRIYHIAATRKTCMQRLGGKVSTVRIPLVSLCTSLLPPFPLDLASTLRNRVLF